MAAPDEGLIRVIVRLPTKRISSEVFRHMGPGYSPRSGEGARIQGGRWNPPNSFPVLYLAWQRETAIAEFYRRAEREGIPPENLLPRHLHRYRVELQGVLDLTNPEMADAVGLTRDAFTATDASRCQAVGDAAHYVGCEAVLALSATGIGEVVAVFSDRLRAGSIVEPLDYEVWDIPPPRPG